MHEFKYKGDELFCEDVGIGGIAAAVGTPFYLYSHKTLLDHYRKLRAAFSEINPLICFSMKSNSSLAVLTTLVKAGSGLDVVSGGELFKALRVGCDPKKIVYASVGKTEREIENAVKAGILFFNVESLPELALINKVACRLGRTVDCALRANPDVDPHTHKFITTGKADNKFGLDLRTVEETFVNSKAYTHVRMRGIHVHIGSQITESAPFRKAITKVGGLIKRIRKSGARVDWLNIGGGLGIIYRNERPQSAERFAKAVIPMIRKLDVRLILEPGRFIVGNSGILVAKVTYVKKARSKNFIIVDAAMNDLMRPSLYDAYHEIVPVIRRPVRRRILADVVGPICESGDVLAKDRKLPEFRSGELIAVMGAGAYGFTMSSNYNSRPRSAEVMVIHGKFYVVRERERYDDLVRGENIPKELK
ncbi:MAG TPA: diaminopimelate decarboxylase [Candidatus Omnitrophota bacterium]|nr:diaminopimelate decarboxylase [Candidatus Omnitrophota bacterium]HOX09765.1 diaminopimelate decarboxylase [Candidatus Omnitrophota bacterium]HPN66721.1 diaminopimelate decarboxylase [Candidatus Omnitrophota bacterium]HRZ66592.1 diaminopimelate decarboxylase [Candidatus Omnitrophota bacterium]